MSNETKREPTVPVVILALDELAQMRAERDNIERTAKDAAAALLPPELREQMKEVEDVFSGEIRVVDQRIQELTELVKADTLAIGGSIKGSWLQAVWARGRRAWDADALEDYAVAHPEILTFRSVGSPTVAIREVKS